MRSENSSEWEDLPGVKTLPNEAWLPVFIRCRDLDERGSSGDVETMLRQSLRKLPAAQDEMDALVSLLGLKIDRGEALLLIDGLDEIPATNTRRAFCEAVGTLSELHKTTPILLTSRIVGYREIHYRLGHGFEHLTIADLSSKDKDEFVTHWCGLTELQEHSEAAVDDLVRYIHDNDRIERLTGNPTLLTTVPRRLRGVTQYRSFEVTRTKNEIPKRSVDDCRWW